MELKRLERAIAERWWLVAGLAVAGVLAALLFGSISNRNPTSLFEATASVGFAVPEGGTIAELADELTAASELANTVAADILEANPDARILEDLANAELDFIAQGGTRAEAAATATELRQAFLDVDRTLGGQVDELIEEIEEEAAAIQEQIDVLFPPLTPEEEDLIAEHTRVDQLMANVQARLDALLIEEAGATTAERRSEIASERANLNELMTELRVEKTALGPVPTQPVLSPTEQLQLTALESRLEALTADYQRLYLRQQGVGGAAQPVVQDLTPGPTDPLVNAAIGLVGGLLIATLAIIFMNRTRRPVWIPEDISIPVLGSVPGRRVSADTSENWYDEAEPGERKAAIQALRSAVEAQVPSTGATIALTALSAPAEGVQALAADLVSSMASAGTSVLLVDANFESRSSLGQYKVAGASVADILALNPSAPEFEAQVRFAVEEAFRVRPGLSVLPSGPPPASPADQLAGRQFRHLIAVGQETYDVVVVVVDSVDSPAAQVTMQRLGYGILVLAPGRTTIPEVDGVLQDVDRLRISMLGAVFLGKVSGVVPSVSPDSSRKQRKNVVSEPTPSETIPQSPISRLHNYPILDERRTAVIPHGSLDELAENIGADQSGDDDDFAAQLLVALEQAPAEQALVSVSTYLMSQVEDMVRARHGHGGLSDELIGAMSDYGFMSLRSLKGFQTPAEWLAHEISAEAGPNLTQELVAAMESVLGEGGEPISIDDWLAKEFFKRHLERTIGEPEVWQLTSSDASIDLLVPARRMTAERLELILAEVVGRSIDDFERLRAAAVTRSDLDAAGRLEASIEDARSFERAVNDLIRADGNGRSKGADRRWRPDWSKGTRANLAPLQAVGILPFKVLSPEEMSEIRASA